MNIIKPNPTQIKRLYYTNYINVHTSTEFVTLELN